MSKSKSTASLKAPKSRKSTQIGDPTGSSQIPISSQSSSDVNVIRLTDDLNTEELTATITKSVTDIVLCYLRQMGILSPPSTRELEPNQTTIEGPTSSNTNSGQEHMTLSTASSSPSVTGGYISSEHLFMPLFHTRREKMKWGVY